MSNLSGYKLSRSFVDYAFENPDKIKSHHYAIYFFAIEHCNRLGWKKKFGFPTTMVMEATGIKSYQTYIKHFRELVIWEFFEVIQLSKNQWSSYIIALSNFDKANDKALSKASTKHDRKQDLKQLHSIIQSNCSINKLRNLEHLNFETLETIVEHFFEIENFVKQISTPGAAPKIDPSSSARMTAFALIRHDYEQSRLFTFTNAVIKHAKELIQKIAKYKSIHRGAPGADKAIYDYYQKMCGSDSFWVKDKLSMENLNRRFEEIVATLDKSSGGDDYGNSKSVV